MRYVNASGPLKNYRTLPEIRARLAVLYAKADRITAYNDLLDPSLLDEKQLVTMVEKKRVLGVDEYPAGAFNKSLRASIDFLERRRRKLERRATRVVVSLDGRKLASVPSRPTFWQRLTRRAA